MIIIPFIIHYRNNRIISETMVCITVNVYDFFCRVFEHFLDSGEVGLVYAKAGWSKA